MATKQKLVKEADKLWYFLLDLQEKNELNDPLKATRINKIAYKVNQRRIRREKKLNEQDDG